MIWITFTTLLSLIAVVAGNVTCPETTTTCDECADTSGCEGCHITFTDESWSLAQHDESLKGLAKEFVLCERTVEISVASCAQLTTYKNYSVTAYECNFSEGCPVTTHTCSECSKYDGCKGCQTSFGESWVTAKDDATVNVYGKDFVACSNSTSFPEGCGLPGMFKEYMTTTGECGSSCPSTTTSCEKCSATNGCEGCAYRISDETWKLASADPVLQVLGQSFVRCLPVNSSVTCGAPKVYRGFTLSTRKCNSRCPEVVLDCKKDCLDLEGCEGCHFTFTDDSWAVANHSIYPRDFIYCYSEEELPEYCGKQVLLEDEQMAYVLDSQICGSGAAFSKKLTVGAVLSGFVVVNLLR